MSYEGKNQEGTRHLGAAVGSSTTDKAGQNPIYCQGSSAVPMSNLIKTCLPLFPFNLAAAFLVAACAERALDKGGSIFLHICPALAFVKDWNLERKGGGTV